MTRSASISTSGCPSSCANAGCDQLCENASATGCPRMAAGVVVWCGGDGREWMVDVTCDLGRRRTEQRDFVLDCGGRTKPLVGVTNQQERKANAGKSDDGEADRMRRRSGEAVVRLRWQGLPARAALPDSAREGRTNDGQEGRKGGAACLTTSDHV